MIGHTRSVGWNTAILLVLLLVCLAIAVTVHAATEIEAGTNLWSMDWTPEGSPYLIMGEAVVKSGSVLTIHPGTVIMPGDGPGLKKIRVQGRLIAIGNPDNMISFVSPSESDLFAGLIFEAGEGESNSILRYCNLTGLGVFGVHTQGQVVEVEYCRIDSSRSLNTFNVSKESRVLILNSLFMDGNIHCSAGSELIFENNLAIGKFGGIELSDQSRAQIRKNTIVISDTVLYAVTAKGDVYADIDGNNIITARHAVKSENTLYLGLNWWGHPSPKKEIFSGEVVLNRQMLQPANLDFAWTVIEPAGDEEEGAVGTYIIDPAKVVGAVEDED